jgi:hypothetical protein
LRPTARAGFLRRGPEIKERAHRPKPTPRSEFRELRCSAIPPTPHRTETKKAEADQAEGGGSGTGETVVTNVISAKSTFAGTVANLVIRLRAKATGGFSHPEEGRRPVSKGEVSCFEMRPSGAPQHEGAILAFAGLAAMAEVVIGEHDGHHRLADRHGADADARIVAALGRDLGFVAGGIDGAARREDR